MEFLDHVWGYILAITAAIVWLIRLEGRTLSHDREIARMREQRHEDLAATSESRGEMLNMLAEIRGDIKTLMRKE